jgi:hypothetical protein
MGALSSLATSKPKLLSAPKARAGKLRYRGLPACGSCKSQCGSDMLVPEPHAEAEYAEWNLKRYAVYLSGSDFSC